jgi:phosphoribosylanthranilate isomerase
MKLKVCGLKDRENILQVLDAGPDYIGFIFYPASARYAGDLDPVFVNSISAAKKVGVFVNEKEINILDRVARYGSDLVQLHGDESPEFCALIRKSAPVMKAFRIDENFDFSSLKIYEDVCDYFLFDSNSDGYGGSGKTFDHALLDQYASKKKYFLGGGIDASVAGATQSLKAKHKNLYCLDVNSKFETEPGIKDINKLKMFAEKLKV